jgi:hypothetical protein
MDILGLLQLRFVFEILTTDQITRRRGEFLSDLFSALDFKTHRHQTTATATPGDKKRD